MLLKLETRKKLQEFLLAMPEESLSVLIKGIEKSRLSGNDDPLTNMILFTARQNARSQSLKLPRVPGPLRLFSIPFEIFLINNAVGNKQAGRIDRSSVLKVWQWLARDLMPDQLSRLSEQIKSAIMAGDQSKARTLTEKLRTEAREAIRKVVADFDKYPKDEARIAGQLGGNQVLADAIDIANILACEEDLRILQKRFSSHINELKDEDITWCLRQLEKFNASHPEMLPHGLVLVMQQLVRPSEIIRIAKACVGTDDAIKIEAHPYSVAIDLVLFEVRCKVKEICDYIDREEDIDQIGSLVTAYYDLMHYLQIELEIPSSSKWAKTITQLRTKLSDRLSSKLQEAPRLIKAALKADDDGLKSPATADVDAAVYVLRLMNICRLAVNELALNELLSRIRREIEQFLNVMGDAAVENLRNSSAGQRAAAQARADTAVYLTQIVFGNDISDLLRKAANVARQAAEDGSDYTMADSA